MLSRVRLIASLAAIVVAGGATAPCASAASSDDACSLLTPAEVSAAVKTAVGKGSYVTPTFKKTCTWTASEAANGVRFVTLYLEGLTMYAAGKRAASNVGVSDTALSGIGDEAYYMTTGNLVALHVKKGGTALKVAVYARAPAEQVQAMEKTLAQAAVGKL